MLGAARDLCLDPDFLQFLPEEEAGVGYVAVALVALLGDQMLDLRVLARMQRGEGEVFQFPLDRVDTQAVSQRGVDLERLAGLLDLLLLRAANPSVRMLWSRSASLTRMTRTSVAIAIIILR